MTEYKLNIGGKTKRSQAGQHEVIIDFDALPEASKDFIIRYGLKQYLADGMAGATEPSAAKAGINARVTKLKEANFERTRGEAGPVDDEAVLARRLARDEFLAAVKAAGADFQSGWKELDKDKKAAHIAGFFEKNKDRFTKEAKAQIDKRKAAASGIDLKALLG
jgi:hypothetical protein